MLQCPRCSAQTMSNQPYSRLPNTVLKWGFSGPLVQVQCGESDCPPPATQEVFAAANISCQAIILVGMRPATGASSRKESPLKNVSCLGFAPLSGNGQNVHEMLVDISAVFSDPPKAPGGANARTRGRYRHGSFTQTDAMRESQYSQAFLVQGHKHRPMGSQYHAELG